MTISDDKIIREAMRLLGSRTSAAKAASSRANGAKGGRPRKEGTPRPTSPPPTRTQTGVPPLWQRLEAFLRANGPSTLRTLRCVSVNLAERERVGQVLQRRPANFHRTPSPTFGDDVWELC